MTGEPAAGAPTRNGSSGSVARSPLEAPASQRRADRPERHKGPQLGHRDAWVEVELDAIVANARALASLCAPDCQLAPVVKGNAYGHGAVAVSRALTEAGFGMLCVATLDEAIELRSARIRGRILLLYEPPLGALDDVLDANVEVALGTPEGLEAVAALSETDRHRMAIQLKLDTGMSRQGLRLDRIEQLEDALRLVAGSVRGIWTHLADGANQQTATEQLKRFDEAVLWLRCLGIAAERHTSGSAAILAGYGTAYEMARPGLALYGVIPDEYAETGAALPVELRPAMAIRARPIRVEWLPSGTPVGYGGTYKTTKPTKLVLLPIGYGDGLCRSLGNGRSRAIYHGRKATIVGRVSMDSCAVDVTDLGPTPPVNRDSVFTLVGGEGGERTSIEELARAAGTIPQEILLGFDDRLPIVYVPASLD
jgi:alanine racemase